MAKSARLDGFKIHKDVVWASFTWPRGKKKPLGFFFTTLADKRINISLVTGVNESLTWRLNIAFESYNAKKALSLNSGRIGSRNIRTSEGSILSVFPHRKSPEITGVILEIFGDKGFKPGAFACSSSAISMFLVDSVIEKAAGDLFESLNFTAYQTPQDWKLAQKGKEKLFKEVVASYQEKKPKVYFLEWQDSQSYLQVKTNIRNMSRMGLVFKQFARLRVPLSFFISGPDAIKNNTDFTFCLPFSSEHAYPGIIKKIIPDAQITQTDQVAMFSLNGPHFGDRYGIVSELITSLDHFEVELLALSCSIHSITGVLPVDQANRAITAIKECFDVPSVLKKTDL